MAITHERTGEQRPALWDVETGAVTDLVVDLEGPVEPVDWWPDGSALLLRQLVEGRHRLHRYDLLSGAVEVLDTEAGSITSAAVRPDGAVWYRVHAGEHPARLLAVGSSSPLLAPAGPVGAGRPAVRDLVVHEPEGPARARVPGPARGRGPASP